MNVAVALQRGRSVHAGLVRLVRPRQWIKNGFVLAPLIFAGRFTGAGAITAAVVAAVLFCVASGATYILNDYVDVERDRQHPVKSKTRPLASGQVSQRQAITLLGVLYGALATSFLWQPTVVVAIASYLLLNLAYTLVLKHHAVADLFTIALGFVLRVYVGALAIDVPLSTWMFVTTLCLALYLAAVKRRQELIQNGHRGREVLASYTVALVDRYAEMSAIGALLFYSLFVMTTRPELAITIPVVLYGFFRYWFVVEALDGGESPTDALLSDWQLMMTVAGWIGLSMWALWPATP